jgi:hypothetical protein
MTAPEPTATRTVNGDFEKISACTNEALDRAYPGFINSDDQSAPGTVKIIYDALVGEGQQPYREFEVTISKASDSTATVAVKERQGLAGVEDRYAKQIFPVVEACASASRSTAIVAPKPKQKRKTPAKSKQQAVTSPAGTTTEKQSVPAPAIEAIRPSQE